MHIAAVVLAEILLAEVLVDALVQNYQSLDDAIERGKPYAGGHHIREDVWQAFEVWRRLLEEDPPRTGTRTLKIVQPCLLE